MAIFICMCEEEYFKNHCSQECDICPFGVPEDCKPNNLCVTCEHTYCEHWPIDTGQGNGVRCNCCGALITDSNYRLCKECQHDPSN